jgi:hypothetical protein
VKTISCAVAVLNTPLVNEVLFVLFVTCAKSVWPVVPDIQIAVTLPKALTLANETVAEVIDAARLGLTKFTAYRFEDK